MTSRERIYRQPRLFDPGPAGDPNLYFHYSQDERFNRRPEAPGAGFVHVGTPQAAMDRALKVEPPQRSRGGMMHVYRIAPDHMLNDPETEVEDAYANLAAGSRSVTPMAWDFFTRPDDAEDWEIADGAWAGTYDHAMGYPEDEDDLDEWLDRPTYEFAYPEGTAPSEGFTQAPGAERNWANRVAASLTHYGKPRYGLYYQNVVEDMNSTSAVVPSRGLRHVGSVPHSPTWTEPAGRGRRIEKRAEPTGVRVTRTIDEEPQAFQPQLPEFWNLLR